MFAGIKDTHTQTERTLVMIMMTIVITISIMNAITIMVPTLKREQNAGRDRQYAANGTWNHGLGR